MKVLYGLQPDLAKALTDEALAAMTTAVTTAEWDMIADRLERAARAARATARELAPNGCRLCAAGVPRRVVR